MWSGKKEYVANKNTLSNYTMLSIKENGKVIYGDNIIPKFKEISKEEIYKENKIFLKHALPFIKVNDNINSIDWFFIVSSMVYFLEKEKLVSKSHAALWAFNNIKEKWTKVIPKCIAIRQNPNLYNISEYKNWLLTLKPYLDDLKEYIIRKFI